MFNFFITLDLICNFRLQSCSENECISPIKQGFSFLFENNQCNVTRMLTKRTSHINNDRKYALDTSSRYISLLNIDSDSTGWKENIYHGIFTNASIYCTKICIAYKV